MACKKPDRHKNKDNANGRSFAERKSLGLAYEDHGTNDRTQNEQDSVSI